MGQRVCVCVCVCLFLCVLILMDLLLEGRKKESIRVLVPLTNKKEKGQESNLDKIKSYLKQKRKEKKG